MSDFIGKKDALGVKLVREAGGIPFVKSNNPQIVFCLNNENTIYGVAMNPHNPGRTTGGSSGGEGGLVSTKCSPVGLGTDIAGSIRCPAAFCGTYGFKPTPFRVSYLGAILPAKDSLLPQTRIIPSMGPFAGSVNDIKVMTDVLFRAF
jgi:Asp-tRNA(Asn)/Glu-tRNA(Gln) amidotransferase A subunit family amidase